MSNQVTLQAVQRGYRMEKPNYPGNTTPENLDAIYNVRFDYNCHTNESCQYCSPYQSCSTLLLTIPENKLRILFKTSQYAEKI